MIIPTAIKANIDANKSNISADRICTQFLSATVSNKITIAIKLKKEVIEKETALLN